MHLVNNVCKVNAMNQKRTTVFVLKSLFGEINKALKETLYETAALDPRLTTQSTILTETEDENSI